MLPQAPPAGGPWHYGEPELRVMVLLLGHANRPPRARLTHLVRLEPTHAFVLQAALQLKLTQGNQR